MYTIFYTIIGWIILPFVITYSVIKGSTTLPDFFFTFDNMEDGYDGNKRGWYDKYNNHIVKELSKLKQVWYAYRWCAMRNPAWNLRFHKNASIAVSHIHLQHVGTTRSHDWAEGFQWYDCTFQVDFETYKAHFRLIPITKNKSLYVRWGWKIYPEFYATMARQSRIPQYKKRSIKTLSIRLRSRGEQK